MKVTSTTSPLVTHGHAKPSGARQSSTSTDEAAGTAEATAAAPARTSVPPGLERVLGRLQSMAPGSMNRGQANALQHIEANIARYRTNHGIATPLPADSAPATTATSASTSGPTAASTTDPTSTSPSAATAAPTTSSPTSVPATSTDSTAVASSTQTSTGAALIDSIPPAGSLIKTQA